MQIKFGKFFVVLILWLSQAACSPLKTMHSTYGNIYKDVIGKQQGNHQSRPLAPLRGAEATSLVNAYYQGLVGGNTNAAGASNSSSTTGATQSSALSSTSHPTSAPR